MHALAVWVLMLLAVCSMEGAGQQLDYCYAEDTNPYLYFSSKTAYELVYNKTQSQDEVGIPHCEPVQIWLLVRHGTRYPSRSTIKKLMNLTKLRDQIVSNHESGNHDGRLCNQDIENLKAWQLNVTENQASNLSEQGEEDLESMALRLKQKFPSLLNYTYSSDRYQFQFTNTSRTRASAKSFATGLFGSSSPINFPEPPDDTTLLSSFYSCEAWKQAVEGNPEATKEAQLFKESASVTTVLQNVSSRLGFGHTLKYEDIDTMYDMCRYDKAWSVNDRSPWCAAFNKDELKVMEYLEDIKYYYKCGYGHEINIKLGCPPVKDFMDRFSKLEDKNLIKDQQPIGIFYFSHITMLLMVQSRMGIFKDSTPLLHSNYDSMEKREWRLSNTGPFATNIAAVFFKCTEGDKNRVMFYVSENPLDIEGCKVGLCSWEYIKKKYSSISQDCNLDFCDTQNNSDNNDSVRICATSFWYILSIAVVPIFMNVKYFK